MKEIVSEFFDCQPYRFEPGPVLDDLLEEVPNAIMFHHREPEMEFSFVIDEDETDLSLTRKVAEVLYSKFPKEQFEQNLTDWLMLLERNNSADEKENTVSLEDFRHMLPLEEAA